MRVPSIRALFHDATTTGEEVRNPGGSGSVGGGGITFEALKAQLTKHDGLLQVIRTHFLIV
jgi:hypothetical protein